MGWFLNNILYVKYAESSGENIPSLLLIQITFFRTGIIASLFQLPQDDLSIFLFK